MVDGVFGVESIHSMFSTIVRTALVPLRAQHHASRSFVSTVLLSKTYDDKTVAELRAELRSRGLPSYGFFCINTHSHELKTLYFNNALISQNRE